MQQTLKEKLALIQSSHLSDDPADGDKTDVLPRPSDKAISVLEGADVEAVDKETDVVVLSES